MSNLSQFYGGGGPSNIIRGSTTFETTIGNNAPGIAVVTVSTGVFVDPATTYLSQGCRGDAAFYTTSNSGFGGGTSTTGTFTGNGSARINGSGEVVITSGVGQSIYQERGTGFNTRVTTNSAVMKGVVDWEAVEFG